MAYYKLLTSITLGAAIGFFVRGAIFEQTDTKSADDNERARVGAVSTWQNMTDTSVFDTLETGIAPSLFYAKIFDGLVSIPNRYYLSEISADRAVFSSNLLIGQNEEFLRGQRDLPISQSGHIVFGKFSDLNTDAASMKSLIEENSDVAASCFGFNQIVIHLSISSLQKTLTQGFFYNEESYLSIVDENPELWREMLFDFERNAEDVEIGCLDDVDVNEMSI